MVSRKPVVGLLAILIPALAAGQQAPPVAEVTVQAGSTSTQAPAAEPKVVLDELVREAVDRNPGLKSAQRQVQAMRHRIPQVKTLPDPTVSVGWMGNITPFSVQKGDPSSFRMVSASQELPYPGKLKLRGQIVDREAQATFWEYEAKRRRVVADVKAAYYDYFYYDRATEITLKNKDLLEKLAKIAEVRYQVGQGIQPDVLKAQVEVSRLQQQLTILEQLKKTAQVRLNTLLFRAPDEPLGKPEPVSKAEFGYSLDDLYRMALEKDADLQRQERVIEQNQYAVNLAQKQYYPDFAVGFQYVNRPALPEMYSATFTLNIPIFYKTKQREGVREATESLVGAEGARDDRKTTLFFEVKEQYLTAKAAENLLGLYSKAIVPQSTLALESSMASYQTGRVDYLTVLSNFLTVLEYEVNYYRELANYQMALARLEPFVGTELTK